MNTCNTRVLSMLKKRKKLGVTFDNFGRGFRLGARIFDLREAGYKILTIREKVSDECTRARYVLQQEKR